MRLSNPNEIAVFSAHIAPAQVKGASTALARARRLG